MELTFQTSPLHFLRCVVQEVHFQEETSDTIVPDSYPDIASILDCYADPMLRGKDCRDKSVTISGGLKGGILYLPENEAAPRCLELYMPFTVKFDHPDLTERSQVIVSVRVRSVDARMINSRKAMLRVGIGCEITAYEQDKEELYDLKAADPRLQLKTEQYTVELPLETSEKSFVLNDSMELSGHPALEHICKSILTVFPADQKIVANKAVFKGNLNCKILYMTADHSLHCIQHQFPYSQYCELTTDYDDETVTVYPVITGYDLEPDQPENPSSILMTVHILMQCLVSGKKELNMITDAYTTSGTLVPQWKKYTFRTCLDNTNVQKTLRKMISGNIRSVLDTDLYWDYPVLQRSGDSMKVSAPVSVRVLGKDDNDFWTQKTERAELAEEIPMDDSCSCRAAVVPGSDSYAVLSTGGIEVNAAAMLQSVCCAGNTLKTLSGAAIEEEEDNGTSTPSLIVKNIEKNTPVWDLAKTYRTTEQRIKAANGLNSDQIPEDMLILLPIT